MENKLFRFFFLVLRCRVYRQNFPNIVLILLCEPVWRFLQADSTVWISFRGSVRRANMEISVVVFSHPEAKAHRKQISIPRRTHISGSHGDNYVLSNVCCMLNHSVSHVSPNDCTNIPSHTYVECGCWRFVLSYTVRFYNYNKKRGWVCAPDLMEIPKRIPGWVW